MLLRPHWQLDYCPLDFVRPRGSPYGTQERNGEKKRGRKAMATAKLSKPLNPAWLHLWIIIPHEVMPMHILKCSKTTDKFCQ